MNNELPKIITYGLVIQDNGYLSVVRYVDGDKVDVCLYKDDAEAKAQYDDLKKGSSNE